jgi:hypothetical protein
VIYVLISIGGVVAMAGAIVLLAFIDEVRAFNKGKCKKCGKTFSYVILPNNFRSYICEDCMEGPIISFDKVDKKYLKGDN